VVLLHGKRAVARRGALRQVQGGVQPAWRQRRGDRWLGGRHQPRAGRAQEKYVATVPQIFDLWQDPQERYDIFMNNYTERTWTMVPIGQELTELMKTYVKYPPRKLQSMGYDGPIELSKYQKFQYVREMLAKDGIVIPLPTGN
jgi:hypothetical protein